ncbi:carbohydrate kinase [Halothiobacillus diazotrophicus]|uniref:D-ribulose kinase n=2 Tax=Halothiobacillus diazotrophicus TaxID=1860122 RepID=A0A191ZKB2_9GAMM|nr:carbohydrate kinase [Halothiobacillus diazotrophicus]
MSTPLYLGLDFGTSGARACVIADLGDERTEIEEFARLEFGELAESELAGGWRQVLFDLIADLPLGLRKRLAAIAISGTSGTVLACDGALNPLHPPLLYNDARATEESARLAEIAGETHPVATATSGLAKAIWLHSRLTAQPDLKLLHQADWLAGLLTGGSGVSDVHNALKMGFDPATLAWPQWMADVIPRATLPTVLLPGATIGPILRAQARALSLSTECLVRTGTTDSIAAFLAAGARQPGDAVTSLGTTLALKLISEQRVDDARFGVYSHWYGRYWLAGGASNAGGGVLRQYFSSTELTELSARIEPEQPSGLDYYPLPRPGERFPINDPNLPPRLEPVPEDRVTFLHGLLDGLAHIEARGYAKLEELGASPVRQVLSSGGGAINDTYTRIRAQRLGMPTMNATMQEAAYGSALLAARGTALFPMVP